MVAPFVDMSKPMGRHIGRDVCVLVARTTKDVQAVCESLEATAVEQGVKRMPKRNVYVGYLASLADALMLLQASGALVIG